MKALYVTTLDWTSLACEIQNKGFTTWDMECTSAPCSNPQSPPYTWTLQDVWDFQYNTWEFVKQCVVIFTRWYMQPLYSWWLFGDCTYSTHIILTKQAKVTKPPKCFGKEKANFFLRKNIETLVLYNVVAWSTKHRHLWTITLWCIHTQWPLKRSLKWICN